MVQPDGSILKCFASGDEYTNHLHDKNGFTIVQNPKTGYWVYARKVGENVITTDYLPERVNPGTLNIMKGSGKSIDYIETQRKKIKQLNQDINYQASTSGVINNIVVFIRFSDQDEI